MKKFRERLFYIVAFILFLSFPYWGNPSWADYVPIIIATVLAGTVLLLVGMGLFYGIRHNAQARKSRQDQSQDD